MQQTVVGVSALILPVYRIPFSLESSNKKAPEIPFQIYPKITKVNATFVALELRHINVA